MVLLLKASIATLIFAIGLSSTLDDVTFVWRHPSLLLRSLLAMYVVVPAAAILMAKVLDLPWGTEVALVVLAICAGAPLLPKKVLNLGGDPSYIFSLVVTTSVLAIGTVPYGVRLLSGFLGLETSVTPGQIAGTIFTAFLLPLGAGMLVRAVRSDLAEKLGDVLLRVASITLLICGVAVLVFSFSLVRDLGLPSLLAFAVFVAVSLAAGHLLGGPDPAERTSLAVACASRHVGLALLVATSYRGEKAIAIVAAYLIASAAVSIPYIAWRRRVLDAVGPSGDPA